MTSFYNTWCAEDDVGGRVDQVGKGVAVPVELDLERANDAVVQDGEDDQHGVNHGKHHLE